MTLDHFKEDIPGPRTEDPTTIVPHPQLCQAPAEGLTLSKEMLTDIREKVMSLIGEGVGGKRPSDEESGEKGVSGRKEEEHPQRLAGAWR